MLSCNLYFGISEKRELIGLQMHARDQKLKFSASHVSLARSFSSFNQKERKLTGSHVIRHLIACQPHNAMYQSTVALGNVTFF